MNLETYTPDRTWKLPPLILHPFSDSSSPQKLVQSSRASLMLQGLLPKETYSIQELQQILLDGRYCEIRMLYYVGKDLVRWIDQSAEFVSREAELNASGIVWQSFSELVVEDPPLPVRDKLRTWGVADYRSIFARAIGLNAVFADAPERTLLADEFIRNYTSLRIICMRASRRKRNSCLSAPPTLTSICSPQASIPECWSANGRITKIAYIIQTWSFPVFCWSGNTSLIAL